MLTAGKVIIIDGNPQTRGRLREVLRSVLLKAQYQYFRTLAEGLESIKASPNFDLVFISSSFPMEALQAAVAEIRALPSDPSPLIIISLSGAALDVTFATNLYVHGAHGFICEPYSPEELSELITTARDESQKSLEQADKDRRAADFLLQEGMKLLDQFAEYRSGGRLGKGKVGRELQQVAEGFRAVAEKLMPPELEHMLVERFIRAKTTKKGPPEERKSARPRVLHPHPGAVLRDLMQSRGLNREKILSVAHIEEAQLDLLLNEQLSVDEELARDLARALGRTSIYWIGLQKAWDSQQREIEKENAKEE